MDIFKQLNNTALKRNKAFAVGLTVNELYLAAIKESGWKFCENWPIGGWKKYSLYTLYYLSIVISQDLDGIFSYCLFLVYVG